MSQIDKPWERICRSDGSRERVPESIVRAKALLTYTDYLSAKMAVAKGRLETYSYIYRRVGN